MSEISITWSSDQRQLMADMQKRQVMIEKDVLGLKKTADAGKAAGTVLTSSYRESTKEIERLGRVADTAFKQPLSAMDKHLNRMKELRVLFRMGKIDAEQFDRAVSGSRKQLYSDTGVTARLAQWKKEREQRQAMQQQELASQRAAVATSLAEQKAAAAALQLQRMTALHEAAKDERSLAAKSLAEQKAAAMSLQLQKLTALHELQQQEKAAAAKSLAEQKKAAQSLQLQKLTALEENRANEQRARDEELARSRAFYAERRKLWESEAAAQEAAKQKAAAKVIKDQAAERAAQASFYLERRQFWEADAAAQKEQLKSLGDQVRRSLMNERELARQNFRERMRQLWDLRKQGAITQQEYIAASRQAYDSMKKIGDVDLRGPFSGLTAQIQSGIAALGSFHAMQRLIVSEFENMRRRQEKALTVQKPYAEEFRISRMNLEDQTPEKMDWLDKEVQRIAKSTGIDHATVMRGAGDVLGAKAGATDAQALAAYEEAANLIGNKPQLVDATAASVVQTMPFQKNMSSREVLGRFIKSRQLTPTKDLPFFQNVAPQLAIGGEKDPMDELSALWGYFANALQDKEEGNISVNQMIHMRKLMEEQMHDVPGSTAQKFEAFWTDKYKDRRETVLGQFMTESGLNPEQANELAMTTDKDKVPGYAKGFFPAVSLLRGDKAPVEQYRRLLRENKMTPQEAEGVVNKLNAHADANPRLNAEKAGRKAETATENISLNDPQSRIAQIMSATDKAMTATGHSDFKVFASRQFGWLRSKVYGEDESVSQLQRLQNAVNAKKNLAEMAEEQAQSSVVTDGFRKRKIEEAAHNREDYAKLIAVLDELKLLIKDQNNAPQAIAPQVNVQVNVPAATDKPAAPPAAGLQGGRF